MLSFLTFTNHFWSLRNLVQVICNKIICTDLRFGIIIHRGFDLYLELIKVLIFVVDFGVAVFGALLRMGFRVFLGLIKLLYVTLSEFLVGLEDVWLLYGDIVEVQTYGLFLLVLDLHHSLLQHCHILRAWFIAIYIFPLDYCLHNQKVDYS